MLTTRRHDRQSSSSATTSTTTNTTTTGSSRRSSFRRWNHLTSSFTKRSHSMLLRYDNVGDNDGDEYYDSRGEEWGGANGQSASSTTTSTTDKEVDMKNSNTSILVVRGQGTEIEHGPTQLDSQRRQQVEDEREMNDDEQRQSSVKVEDRTDVEDQTEGGDKDKKSCGGTAAERNQQNGGIVVTVQNGYNNGTIIQAVKERGVQIESTFTDCDPKTLYTSSPAPDTIETTDGVMIDSSDQPQQQLQQGNFSLILGEDEKRTESNLSSSIVDSIDSIDCDSTVHTQLSNAELPLLQTNSNVIHCTCAPQTRRSPIHPNKKLQELFLPVSVQASGPSTRSTDRALNIFRNMKYKRIKPSNEDTSKRRSTRSGTSAIKPHRFHRGSFAEAASPLIHLKKELPDSHVDREVDELDELDLLVYGINRTCFVKTVAQTTPKTLGDTYGLPVDEELSAIVEESEDVSTRSHSKSSRPAVLPMSCENRAGKLAQYLKRDAEASSMYIGVMHMDASATSNGEHSNVDHSAHVMSLYGIDEGFQFLPTPQKSRSTGKCPTCVPDIEQGTIKESKVDKILEKEDFEKKDPQNCIEEKPCRQKTKEFFDEIWLQGSCESSTGRISDITDIDFLKVYESSYLDSRNGDNAVQENEEGNSLEDILRTPP